MRCFCDSKMDQVFFQVSSFQLTIQTTKPAAYSPEKGPMSGAAYIDKRGREPGSGLTPDKKEARTGSGSDASAALAALGVEDLHCNHPASQGNSSPAKSSARVKA